MIDAFVLAAVQKTEHYCIAAWGTAAALARLLDEDEIVQTMEQALDEGKRLDSEMTKLAEEEINPRMLDEDEQDDEADGRGLTTRMTAKMTTRKRPRTTSAGRQRAVSECRDAERRRQNGRRKTQAGGGRR